MDAQKFRQLVTAMMAHDHDAMNELINAFESEGVRFEEALMYAYNHIDAIKPPTVSEKPAAEKKAQPQDTVPAAASKFGAPKSTTPLSVSPETTSVAGASGLPEFYADADKPGILHVHARGDATGQLFIVSQTIDAEHTVEIATMMKDAVVAAIISKTTMKLKLADNKDSAGNILSRRIQAEFGRDSIKPMEIWSGNAGEAGVIIAILRKALSYAAPDVIAS